MKPSEIINGAYEQAELESMRRKITAAGDYMTEHEVLSAVRAAMEVTADILDNLAERLQKLEANSPQE